MKLSSLVTLLPLAFITIISACSSGGSSSPTYLGTITVANASLPADGTSTTSITVQAKDSAGTNMTAGGLSTVLSTTSGAIGTVTDNGDGTYSATLTSGTEIVTATISGTINGSTITSASIDFTAAPLVNQTASISIDTATGALTVGTQPSDFVLSGSASLNTGTLTVTLEVDSNFTQHVVFNPKVWVSNISDGTFDNTGAASHTFETKDYVYYGPEAMDAAAASATSRDFDITGVTAGTVTFDIEITDSQMLLTRGAYSEGHVLTDSATGVSWGQIDCTAISFRTLDSNATPQLNRGACGSRRMIFSEDGTKIYSTNKTHPTVSVIDTTTLTYPMLSNITSGGDDDTIGSVLDLAFNSDRSKLYALLNEGGHGTSEGSINAGTEPGTIDIKLVELNPATLAVTNRLAIASQAASDNIRAKGIAITPDDSMAAIIVDHEDAGSGIYFVDLEGMTIIDTDAGTPGTQPVAHGTDTALPKSVIFVDNSTAVVNFGGWGSGTYVEDGNGDKLVFIDTSDFSTTEFTSAITNSLGNVWAGDIQRGPDGKIYWTRMCFSTPMKDALAYTGTETLSVIDPATKAETLVQLGNDTDNTNTSACGYGVGLAFNQDNSVLYVANGLYNDTNAAITKLNASTLARIDFDGNTTDSIVGNSDMTQKLSGLYQNVYASGHSMAISPF